MKEPKISTRKKTWKRGTVTADMFGQLVSLAKKITDYGDEDVATHMEKKDEEIDDELGVAVVFDDEEQEEDDDDGAEIKDEVGEEELVIGGEGKKTKDAKQDKDIVSPHVIDGFWVQQQISEIYPVPVTAAEKAGVVLTILGSDSSLPDCENQLMELFEFQSFHTVTKFLKNRDVIVWCTKLARSDADERVNVEVVPRAVCIEPYQDMVDMRVAEWKVKFSKLQGGKETVSLTGETAVAGEGR